MSEKIREMLISTYVSGIEGAMNSCNEALDGIKRELDYPYIPLEISQTIEKSLSCIRRLQALIEEGFKRLNDLMKEEEEETAA